MKNTYKQKGFTLVEMIVSIAIFTIVALVAIGALLKVIDANKKSQSLKTTITNLSFALDSMSREMRVGSNYRCDGDCSTWGSDWTLFFYSSNPVIGGTCTHNLEYAYRFDGNTIQKAEAPSCNYTISDNDFHPLISQDVIFSIAKMRVVKSSDTQPYVQFHFKGYTGKSLKEKSRTYFDVQTTVSQRIPD